MGELVSRSVVGLVQWLQMDYKNLGALASQLKMMEHGDDSNASRAARNVQALIDIEKTAHKQDDCEFEQGGKCFPYQHFFFFPSLPTNESEDVLSILTINIRCCNAVLVKHFFYLKCLFYFFNVFFCIS